LTKQFTSCSRFFSRCLEKTDVSVFKREEAHRLLDGRKLCSSIGSTENVKEQADSSFMLS